MTDLSSDVRHVIAEVLQRTVTVHEVRRIAGGTSHETWACDVSDPPRMEPVIVRRDIGAGVLDGDGQVEFALLGTLHGLGQPVPQQWLRVPARGGRAGMTIMERVAGDDVRKAMARGGVSDRPALGQEIVAVQAALHRVAWRGRLAGVLPGCEAGALGEVERWGRQIEANRAGPEPLLMAALSWLRANLPPPCEPCLVHADFKANNLLLSPDGRVTVIDWELAHAGDPLEDLAWTMLWDTDHDLVGGMLDPAQYVAAYAEASGREVDREALFFWELHALVKLAAIFIAGVRPGVARLPKLLQLARATPVLEARIAAHLDSALERGMA